MNNKLQFQFLIEPLLSHSTSSRFLKQSRKRTEEFSGPNWSLLQSIMQKYPSTLLGRNIGIMPWEGHQNDEKFNLIKDRPGKFESKAERERQNENEKSIRTPDNVIIYPNMVLLSIHPNSVLHIARNNELAWNKIALFSTHQNRN